MATDISSVRILRAAILHCVDDPALVGEQAVHYIEDGLLWMDGAGA